MDSFESSAYSSFLPSVAWVFLAAACLLSLTACSSEPPREVPNELRATIESLVQRGNGTIEVQPPPPSKNSEVNTPEPGSELIEIRLLEEPFRFEPSEITLQAGKAYKFRLIGGQVFHTFTVEELGLDIPVDPGKVIELTYEPPSTKSYGLICRPHEFSGMTGSLTVLPSDKLNDIPPTRPIEESPPVDKTDKDAPTAGTVTGAIQSSQLVAERAFPLLNFETLKTRADEDVGSSSQFRMINFTYPDDGTDRLFIVMQQGQILVFPNDQTTTSFTLFLDISERVNLEEAENGLLNLAFDPNFRQNGYFYVSYSALGDMRRSLVSRFSVSRDNPDAADPDSELIVLEVPQQAVVHNVMRITFGPDGYLYIGVGDDVQGGVAQDTTSLLGSILRIDVSSLDQDGKYSIPADNPFKDQGGGIRQEIWAYGFRNPWSFSFDRLTGQLWAADVGADKFEEVDIVKPGLNYGWSIMEGFECRVRPEKGCDQEGLELPVATYKHGEGESCYAVIGGYVYRGSNLPALLGSYIFADFCSSRVWALKVDGAQVQGPWELFRLSDFYSDTLSQPRISSFGEDPSGELYFLTLANEMYRLANLDGSMTYLDSGSFFKGFWRRFFASNLRKTNATISGRMSQVTAADIEIRPGRQSGLFFQFPYLTDWSSVEGISIPIRFGSLDGLQRARIELWDSGGKRWIWQKDSEAMIQQKDIDEWQVWDVTRPEAVRMDEGFAWDQISQFRILAWANPPVVQAPSVTTIEVGYIGLREGMDR